MVPNVAMLFSFINHVSNCEARIIPASCKNLHSPVLRLRFSLLLNGNISEVSLQRKVRRDIELKCEAVLVIAYYDKCDIAERDLT